jgi:hypothetical protein
MRTPTFDKVDYYKDLLEQGLIKEGFYIRTSNMGLIDEHYCVNSEGKLEGVTDCQCYQGIEGTFSAEEILSGQRISSGWSIESIMGLGFLLRRGEGERK